MAKKARSQKQLASDRKRSLAMKGTRPAFLKSKSKKSSRSVTKKKNSGSHKKKDLTIPLSIVLPAAYPLVQALTFDPSTGQNGYAFNNTKEGAKQTFRSLVKAYSGYDIDTNEFDFGSLMRTYGALFIGIAAHKYVAPTANRILARNNIPLIRV